MATLTELFQMILVLANALYSVVGSEALSKAIASFGRGTRNAKYGNDGGSSLERNLMNCLCDLVENALLLLEYANLGMQQVRCLQGHVKDQKPLSENQLSRIEHDILLELRCQSFNTWFELHKNHVVIDTLNFGRRPDIDEVTNDKEANELFGSLQTIIAALNVINRIVGEIFDICPGIKHFNVDGISYSRLSELAMEITSIRNRMYDNLSDHRVKTSRYSFDETVIWSSCYETYNGRRTLDLLNYRIYYKPDSELQNC